ncbi:MAG: hypothetical protein IJ751_05600, partial [Oscillospiraceae bacterium]|nr:hypothetical protein [Oscillospiraceae bacterium]
MEVKRRVGWRSWLQGAAIYGLIGSLMPYVTGSALGWAGVLLGLLPAVLLRRHPLAGRRGRAAAFLGQLWAVGAMALSLDHCARGLSWYLFSGWSRWGIILPMLALAWRSGALKAVQRERAGKLLFALVALIGGMLVLATAPRVRWCNLADIGWGDVRGGLWALALTLGASSAVFGADAWQPPALGSLLGGSAVA